MSKQQIQHVITIESDLSDPPRYRPTCSCKNYSATWGWTRAGAESRGRAHVERATAADARRAGIIRTAAGEPVVGKRRPGGTGRHRSTGGERGRS